MEAKIDLKRQRSDNIDDHGVRPTAKKPAIHDENDVQAHKTATTVRFLILADTHDAELKNDPKAAFRLPAPAVDVVLHCGDLTQAGDESSIAAAMETLGKIPAELKLVVAGNHDVSLDREYYLGQGGSAVDHERCLATVTGPIARENGVTFLDEGTHSFTLSSGAKFTLFASPYTPRFGQSAFQYPTGHDRFNPPETTPQWATNVATASSTIPVGVDIVMTHGPPKYLLDQTADGASAGCEHLRNALVRARPRLHCFGHVHPGYGAQRIRFDDAADEADNGVFCFPKEYVGRNQARRKGYASLGPSSAEALKEGGREQCLLVNAAIECQDGEPVNAPWLVELDL